MKEIILNDADGAEKRKNKIRPMVDKPHEKTKRNH